MRHFGPPYRWVGYTRFRFRQPLNLSVFRQALNRIIRDRESLHVLFRQQAGEWRQEPITPPEYAPMLFDAEGTPPEVLDGEIRRLVREAALELEIGTWPLFRILVVRTGERCFDITIVGHHIIADLISGEILFTELWKEYYRLLSGAPGSAIPPAPSYLDLVRMLESERLRGSLNGHLEYYRNTFSPPESRLRLPADFEKGPNTEESAESVSRELSESLTASLAQGARKFHKSSFYALLAASVYRMLAKATGQTFITLSHRISGRDLGSGQPRFFGSMGNFAVNFPLGIRMGRARTWHESILDVADALEKVPMGGVTYDFLAEDLPFGLYPDSKLTPVRLNYLGIIPDFPSEAFEHVAEDRGRRLGLPGQPRTALLEIIASIEKGRLRIRFEYSRNFYEESTVAAWADGILAEIGELIDGAAPKAGEKPSSPVGVH
jgi:hypothetical protein